MAKTIGYWVTTALAAFVFLASGAADVYGPPQVFESLKELGYPPYLAMILGIWKLLGGVTILIPRLPTLKEWAYAGMIFDLTGAAASHAASHDGPGKIITPLVIAGIVMASWALRPESRKLQAAKVVELVVS